MSKSLAWTKQWILKPGLYQTGGFTARRFDWAERYTGLDVVQEFCRRNRFGFQHLGEKVIVSIPAHSNLSQAEAILREVFERRNSV